MGGKMTPKQRREASARWYKRQSRRTIRNIGLKRLYGITVDEFDDLLKLQGGVCGVCSGPSMGRGTYHVDHDHKTGKVRGLLCHKCNVALGMVQDSEDHLSRLIAYLRSSRELY